MKTTQGALVGGIKSGRWRAVHLRHTGAKIENAIRKAAIFKMRPGP
jgi:hypothetical protein